MEALATATEAVALARSAKELEPLHRAVGTRSDLLSDTGQFAEAARGRLETWLLARQLGDPLRELCAIGNVGILLSALGHWEQSARYHKRALELAERCGNPGLALLSLSNIASCALKTGDLRSPLRLLASFTGPIASDELSFEVACNTHVTLSHVFVLQGDTARARSHAEEALRLGTSVGIERSIQFSKALIGLVDVKAGQIERGLSALNSCLKYVTTSSKGDIPDLLQLCMHAYEAAGDPERALTYLRRLVSLRRNGVLNSLLVLLKRSVVFEPPTGSVTPITDELMAKAQFLHGQVEARLLLLCDTAINAEVAAGLDIRQSFRIAQLVRVVGKAVGWEAKRIEHAAVGAQLRNIGLVAIPGHQGHSAELEVAARSLMEDHTRFGALLLRRSRLRAVKVAATIAEQHHECFDGSGYPHGLEGTGITEEARLVGLCDAFDTAAHPGQARATPLTVESAILQIQSEAGRRFDPVFAEALCEAIRKLQARATDLDLFLEQGADESPYVCIRTYMDRLLRET
jgi:tetratricopeptide (TPR) repeat protein